MNTTLTRGPGRPRSTAADAAILEAKGDIDGARTKLEEIEKLIIANPNQGLREMSLRGVRRWRAELPA